MLRYFTNRSFGVEIETFGLKYSISVGDRQIIPPYKITSRDLSGTLLPKVPAWQNHIIRRKSELMRRLG